MKSAESGHDYNHILRVYRLSKRIYKEEVLRDPSLDYTVVKMAALLHDVDDWKFLDEYEQKRGDVFMDSLDKSLFTQQ